MDTDTPENYMLLKNICYNMQYLEFLNKELDELELSAVLRPMTIKYFVITGMSVLEGLFTYIVKSNGYWKTICRLTHQLTAEGVGMGSEQNRQWFSSMRSAMLIRVQRALCNLYK